MRNKNPGNIRASAAFKWVGQIGVDAEGFAIFTARKYGYRAMGMVLLHYHLRNPNLTIAGYIDRWAPSNENNTAAYINAVCEFLKVPPMYRPSFPNDLLPLCNAITWDENGPGWWNAAECAEGLGMIKVM